MSKIMDAVAIKKILPHRYPFLLIDRVLEIESGNYIKCIKNVTVNEPHFTGHFPEKPIMPGVLIIEAMAQTTGLLGIHSMETTLKDDMCCMLVGVDKVRFRKPVIPGDQLELQARFIKKKT